MKLRMKLYNLRAFDLVEVALFKPWNDVTAKAKPIQPYTQRFQVTVDVEIVNLDKVAFHSASLAVNKLEICTIETTGIDDVQLSQIGRYRSGGFV